MEVKLFDSKGFVCTISRDEAERRAAESLDIVACRRKGVITRLNLTSQARGRGARSDSRKTFVQIGGTRDPKMQSGALRYDDAGTLAKDDVPIKAWRKSS